MRQIELLKNELRSWKMFSQIKTVKGIDDGSTMRINIMNRELSTSSKKRKIFNSIRSNFLINRKRISITILLLLLFVLVAVVFVGLSHSIHMKKRASNHWHKKDMLPHEFFVTLKYIPIEIVLKRCTFGRCKEHVTQY